ncbi:MAG: SDR family NAD(P)-dependent oxidoreductase [Cypionkella sp.]|nr:SDR family NAD(P)-dependent oxidoreductase [Cypionkella sp.]
MAQASSAGLALITGASAGIGREFARIHAARGGDVILTARRGEALAALAGELQAKHGITAHTIALDLGAAGGARALINAVEKLGLAPDIVINNAGFGGAGQHIDRPLSDELAMIQLNVAALVELTHHYAHAMAQRGAGRILNVGSTAGFLAGPNQAVYFATKNFVNAYTQALDIELRGKGVSISLLAPGYVETEFAQRADLQDAKMVKAGGASAHSTALAGYNAMMAGRAVKITDPKLGFMINWIFPFMPRRVLAKMVGDTQKP